MSVRAVGAFLVLAIAGAAGGYGISALQTDAPLTISMAAPVPAVSPSYPVNEYDVKPDPDLAPLGTGLPLETRVLKEGGFKVEVAGPAGWQVNPLDGPGWNFAPKRSESNTYVLRVEVLAGTRSSVSAARASRILRLESSEDDGNLEHLVIEETADDSFTASYLQGGYQRVTTERFLSLGGSTAYATVAVSGREVDRAGMTDLLERVSASLRKP